MAIKENSLEQVKIAVVWILDLHGSPNEFSAQDLLVIDNETHFSEFALGYRYQFLRVD